MEKKKILYISQEITPYLPESEMSEISRYLPQGVQEKGREIRTFMPRYGCVNERRNQLHEVIRLSGMNLVIEDTDHPLIIKVASIQTARMQVYFIDNEDYFHRKQVVSNSKGEEFADNDERALFFARGVLETVIKLRWAPDVIHCHGWMSALVPLFIKKYYYNNPLFKQSKVIYSVYNNDFKKPLNPEIKGKVLLEGMTPKDVTFLDDPTCLNFNKMAVYYSDALIQGAKEINPELSQYIRESGKPFLAYQSKEDFIEAYDNFYEEIW
ncbi:MAG: glycogen/starch synthase [Mariniphaga sp.]|nr:glycogen/starch synthase [Mariniphaga sp.]MDD4225406.1 glycogen/starch synthase [Mariniphaga sp.]MDD4424311.1 glycogen/starch synthase [Mariniphaga sp.]